MLILTQKPRSKFKSLKVIITDNNFLIYTVPKEKESSYSAFQLEALSNIDLSYDEKQHNFLM